MTYRLIDAIVLDDQLESVKRFSVKGSGTPEIRAESAMKADGCSVSRKVLADSAQPRSNRPGSICRATLMPQGQGASRSEGQSPATFGFLQGQSAYEPDPEDRWTTWGTVSSGFREIEIGWDRLESVGLLAPFLAQQLTPLRAAKTEGVAKGTQAQPV
jgi:hypothetical protein